MDLDVPFVGRASELRQVRTLMDRAERDFGRTLFLRGPGGVGKTRLSEVLVHEAREEGWQAAYGRAFPVGTGVPYAVFSDALRSLLESLDPEAVTVLTRGREEELFLLLPGLDPVEPEPISTAGMTPDEARTRLYWNLTRFLQRLAERTPFLLVLEDLHWADESSLELLHFVARHSTGSRLLILAVYNDEDSGRSPELLLTEQSLVSLEVADVHHLEPLGEADAVTLVEHTFGAPRDVVEPFSRTLFDWTRGNPFFMVEALKALVESGRLRTEGDVWVGWEIRDLELPGTVRETLQARLARLSDGARGVMDLAAVVGSRARHDVIRAVADLSEDELLEALDELLKRHLLRETEEGRAILYEFTHPLLREYVYGELSRARARRKHGQVAQALEEIHGPRAPEHADALAYHFHRAEEARLVPRAVKYLALAGRGALARHANREARDYLRSALTLAEEGDPGEEGPGVGDLAAELARACQRLGDFDQAIALWEQARDEAAGRGDTARVAGMERRLGLAHFWSGRRDLALERYEAALEAARDAGGGSLEIPIRLAEGVCLQETGRPERARESLEKALAGTGDGTPPALGARVHRALLTLLTWTGPPEEAREHGDRAAALAAEAEAPDLLWSVHWSRAVFQGLSGDGAATREAVERCEALADRLQSPLLRLWTSEVTIEYQSAIGEWIKALGLGETNIRRARDLGQTVLLPRILTSTGMVYLGRGEMERGRAMVDEAWELSGADDPETSVRNIHSAVPAHTGRATYHRVAGEYAEAVAVGEAGLAIAEKVGYVAWGIHRLLPVIGEAYLELRDLAGARQVGVRLRRYSERMGHRLGMAWSDALDALVAWLDGDARGAVSLLRAAAEKLEAVPFVYDAARVRRQLAGRLAETGDREGAISELRRVHEIFDRLGARPELAKAREQFRELDTRPPPTVGRGGVEALTSAELEVARLVAEEMSNKAIGRELLKSPRTVSTQVSSIYSKLGISGDPQARAKLKRWVREGVWPGR